MPRAGHRGTRPRLTGRSSPCRRNTLFLGALPIEFQVFIVILLYEFHAPALHERRWTGRIALLRLPATGRVRTKKRACEGLRDSMFSSWPPGASETAPTRRPR